MCLCLRVEGGGGRKQLPPVKMSMRTHVQGWWLQIATTSIHACDLGWWEVLVVVANSYHPRKRACALMFEGGSGWWQPSLKMSLHAHV